MSINTTGVTSSQDLPEKTQGLPLEIRQQIQLEEESIGLGQRRYERKLESAREKKRETSTKPGMSLLRAAVAPVAQGLEEWLAEVYSGKKGPKAVAARKLKEFDPWVASYLACRVVLNTISDDVPIQTVALAISQSLMDERKWRAFEEQMPDYWRVLSERVAKQTTHGRHTRNALTVSGSKQGVVYPEPWPREQALHVGQKMIELILVHTGVIEIAWSENKQSRAARQKGSTKSRSKSKVVRATDKIREWMKHVNDKSALMCPVTLPMVCQPKPWSTHNDGGYIGPLEGKYALVKNAPRAYLEDLDTREMPIVYEAINALQDTAWQVNGGVLKVVQEALAENIPVGGLAMCASVPMPPRPAALDNPEFEKENPDKFKAMLGEWKDKQTDAYGLQASLRSVVRQQGSVVRTAERMVEYPEFYYPYQMDFRGRVYPIPTGLQPQGDDLAKGLLRFAKGEPLGETGAYWLAVHLANSYGYDKAPLDDRVAWVQSHEEQILASAMDPFACQWWSDGDAPWQTLAACIEWLGFKMEGEAYVSHLPVGMDG